MPKSSSPAHRQRHVGAYSFVPPRSPDPSHLAALDTSRLRQGCSRPARHNPDQAAPCFSDLLPQAAGEGVSPPLESTAPHGAWLARAPPGGGNDISPRAETVRCFWLWLRGISWQPCRCGLRRLLAAHMPYLGYEQREGREDDE